jgi:membrane-associated phospholipid phosphatase
VLLAITATVITHFWEDHLWFGALLVGLAVVLWAPELRHRRLRSWWFVYVVGIFAYSLLRALADETGIPTRVHYPISLDRMLFLGADPTAWLQTQLFEPARVGLLDYLTVATHWSFFIVPHALAVGIYLRYRQQFPRFALLMVVTMWLGLPLFFLLPTAPPWFASEVGAIVDVRRVMDYVGASVLGDAYTSLYTALGEPNAVAAMPSIHMAVTFAMYLWVSRHLPPLGGWLLAYSCVMAVSLVYLGEHYVVDLVAGVGCAAIAWWVAQRLAPELPAPVTQPADTGSRRHF